MLVCSQKKKKKILFLNTWWHNHALSWIPIITWIRSQYQVGHISLLNPLAHSGFTKHSRLDNELMRSSFRWLSKPLTLASYLTCACHWSQGQLSDRTWIYHWKFITNREIIHKAHLIRNGLATSFFRVNTGHQIKFLVLSPYAINLKILLFDLDSSQILYPATCHHAP